MPKILSILLTFLILFSGITIHLARHYCGTSIDTKVSFSGKPAGCGMEHSQKNSFDYTFSNKCCEDVISDVTLNNNYFASPFASDNHNLLLSFIFALKAESAPVIEPSVSLSDVFTRPPGAFIPNEVDRQVTCIFRI
jgi:hypothetical protein